jgi:hypothetical protein
MQRNVVVLPSLMACRGLHRGALIRTDTNTYTYTRWEWVPMRVCFLVKQGAVDRVSALPFANKVGGSFVQGAGANAAVTVWYEQTSGWLW